MSSNSSPSLTPSCLPALCLPLPACDFPFVPPATLLPAFPLPYAHSLCNMPPPLPHTCPCMPLFITLPACLPLFVHAGIALHFGLPLAWLLTWPPESSQLSFSSFFSLFCLCHALPSIPFHSKPFPLGWEDWGQGLVCTACTWDFSLLLFSLSFSLLSNMWPFFYHSRLAWHLGMAWRQEKVKNMCLLPSLLLWHGMADTPTPGYSIPQDRHTLCPHPN